MVSVDIPSNPNCAPVDLRVFHEAGAPRMVHQVYLEREPGRPDWYEVTGWTMENTPCPAIAQRVDDSGDGLAHLIYGGDAGLRLRRAGGTDPWRLEDPHQWGEPFLLIGDGSDVR